MTFQVIPIDYVPKSDIEDFFKRANEQGFYRHTSIDVFNHYDRELKSRIWFTYHEGRPMAVLGAHTLFPRREYFGINAYNILDKLAVLDYNRKFFTPRQFYEQHQNLTAQVFFPTYIRWLATLEEDCVPFVTTIAGKRHPYSGHYKMMERYRKMGIWSYWGKEIRTKTLEPMEIDVWKFHPERFLELYEPVPKWEVTYPNSL